MSLIDITPPAFDIDISLAYATSDNITGKPFYRADARPYLHPEGGGVPRRSPSRWRGRLGSG